MIFIGGWGMIFFRFSKFLTSNGKKTVKFVFKLSNLYSNYQICIQIIKFVFKQSNLNINEPTRSHHLATAHRSQQRAVGPGLAPTQALPPISIDLKLYRPLSHPYHLLRTLPPRLRELPPPVRTVAHAIGTNIKSCRCISMNM
jgi:hypothetical protein